MLKHDGNRYFKGVRTTDREGDVDVDRFRSDSPGRDTFAMKAVRVSDGTTCRASRHRRLSAALRPAAPSSTTTRPPPVGDRSTTRPPPELGGGLVGDGEAEAGGLRAAGATTDDVDPVREARSRRPRR